MTGWQPRETAPPVGDFLVYTPDRKSCMAVCSRRRTMNSILELVGGQFAFDVPRWTMWCPLPEPPR
jgi:hypothetical protein